ncbi:MAG: Wzz/FepE/Etk N-terminal domain-containing protein [Panacagrimonas sp.]
MNAEADSSQGALPRDLMGPAMTLKQLWAMVWAYRWFIAVFALTLGVGAAVASKLLPKIFQSTATILVAFQVVDPISGKQFSFNLEESYMATQVEFVQSPRVLLPVVEKLKLSDIKEYTKGYVGDRNPDSLDRWATTVLGKKLEVGTGTLSRFVYVSVEDRDPAFAAVLTNAIADSYVEEQLRQFTDPATARTGRYSTQIEALKSKVDEVQTKVTEFRQRTGLLDLSETQMGSVDSSRLFDLDRRMTEAAAKRQEAELRLRSIGEGDASILSSPLIQSLKTRLQQKVSDLAELTASLGPRHPQILALQDEIRLAREQLDREVSVYGDGARAEVESARAVEGKLRRELDEQRKKVLEGRSQQDEGAVLLRELETATKVYQGALDAFENAQMGTQMAASSASIVTRGTPAAKPIRPIARKNAAIALLLGLFGGIGVSLLIELSNRRVRCREDVERDLGVPVLIELHSSH